MDQTYFHRSECLEKATPNNQIGETIERIVSLRGKMDLDTLLGVY